MAKQKVVEANELLEIWLDTRIELKKDMRSFFIRNSKRKRRLYYVKSVICEILRFWHLKAKIDTMQKTIDELRDLSQPRPLTEKDKKRILKDFFEDDL